MVLVFFVRDLLVISVKFSDFGDIVVNTIVLEAIFMKLS